MSLKLGSILLPIDFGHTHGGHFAPQGQGQSPEILHQELKSLGLHWEQTIHVPLDPPTEDEKALSPLKYDGEIAQAISDSVDFVVDMVDAKILPLVLGGDHTVSLATALGISKTLRRQRLGAIVFDAHTDFNTPGAVVAPGSIPKKRGETFSGNAHGMIHALLSRQVDEAFHLAKLCREFSLFDPKRVVIAGVRSQRYPDLEETLNQLKPTLVSASTLESFAAPDLEKWAIDALELSTSGFKEPFYLSIDCDAFDPKEFPAVATPVEKGMTFNTFEKVLEVWKSDYRFWACLKAIDIAEYCPPLDPAREHLKKLLRPLAKFLEL